ncbi:hypothetical protein WJX72_001773 [[Myrmecia] bisecta]|uniref:Proline dehydrogenase n=1 Tax=[Myrmecia] bisecta TaxID=41462 RepID=A0AAW1P2U6_9CHLO
MATHACLLPCATRAVQGLLSTSHCHPAPLVRILFTSAHQQAAAAAQLQANQPSIQYAPPLQPYIKAVPAPAKFRPATHPAAQGAYSLGPFQPLPFDDPRQAFQSKSSTKLLQSLAVFQACSLKPLVKNADSVLAVARQVAGTRLVNSAIKHTVFQHFCAGEDEETIKPTLRYLQQNGILPIINYAAEADVPGAAEGEESSLSGCVEDACDDNMRVFLQSVEEAAKVDGRGFTAIKITALGQPALLESISSAFTASHLGTDRGRWSVDLRGCAAKHLNTEQLAAFDAMMHRTHTIAAAAAAQPNVRLMVDAEQTYMQPAIDAITIHLQQLHNRGRVVILNTYQCYLKDTRTRIMTDIQRARREGWRFGAKFVRGAYMHQERDIAHQQGVPSPVHDTAQDTHDNYNRCVAEALALVRSEQLELMVASHNQESVDKATCLMHHLSLRPGADGVYFGQLLGMSDHLSFTLGLHGYRAYKVIPYGPVQETIQYLIRRARENSDIMGGVGKETRMIRAELWRRFTQALRGSIRPAVSPEPAAVM